MVSKKALRIHRQARGFSLIELGIVIAVIAVLAAVVIFGRGFIVAGRVSKTVEAIDTMRKAGAAYAGLQSGTVNTSTASEIVPLANRSLLPPLPAGQTTWLVAGGASNPFTVMDIRFQAIGNANVIAIRISTPQPEQVQDIWDSVQTDPNMHKVASTVGAMAGPCLTARPGTGSNIGIFCFKL